MLAGQTIPGVWASAQFCRRLGQHISAATGHRSGAGAAVSAVANS
jgi:hypothetical protein